MYSPLELHSAKKGGKRYAIRSSSTVTLKIFPGVTILRTIDSVNLESGTKIFFICEKDRCLTMRRKSRSKLKTPSPTLSAVPDSRAAAPIRQVCDAEQSNHYCFSSCVGSDI